ncbi:MAG: ATP-grasp domain-containing protein [Acidobacteria bacterium]|nr:ATP-grasp domain-containing protein [Acidobacteriota bacterium]
MNPAFETRPSRNVLITCGGRWAGMIAQVRATLPRVPALASGRLIVADLEIVAPAGYFADATVAVPPLDDPGYVPALLSLCGEQQIRVLLPLIDLDMAQLAPHHAAFAAAGVTLMAPTPQLMQTCFDKVDFDAFARAHGLRTPRLYAPQELDSAPYPLFRKPRRGFGSRGAEAVASAAEAWKALTQDPDLIFMERLIGPEISVDALLSRDGRILHAVQRVRDKVVGGEAVRTHTVKLGPIAGAAERALRALAGAGFHGPANLQFFLSEDPALFDVNLRLGAGGATLSNQATGGHFFEAMLREACGEAAEAPQADYEVGLALYKFSGDTFYGAGGGIRQAFPAQR